MSLSKLKYEASRARLKPLTPIKETSNLYTPRVSEKKTVTVHGNKPIVVQTLPQDYQPRETRDPNPYFSTQSPNPYLSNQSPNPYQSTQSDDLNQIVNEYLHYSKNKSTMPVQHESWDVDRTMTCACCQKRNIESMQLKRDVAIESNQPRTTLDFPHSSNPKDVYKSPKTKQTVEMSQSVKIPSGRSNYQPMQKPRPYIRPEYNRPYVLQDFYESSQLDAKGAYAKTSIIDASAKYQEAMDKLERTTKYLDPDSIKY